ncbi:MAG: glutamate--tRNA ligase [Candidatus Rokubacteria bacterium]|nr:glutamate--tRNA ligase [Candidatus Rokubacteria bacterium]
MPEPVRARFAPSPTGHLHVGGARTALFTWLFARHHRGVFILRIEDTDRSRSTEEYIASILEALRWLGLDWDEGPPTPGYRQTERLEIYKAHAERLLAEGKAYRCACPPEELEAARAAAQARGETFRYSGKCRDQNVAADVPHALRLKIPRSGQTVVQDLIHGRVTFDHGQLDDWILVRTDGSPTYNFCVVVDDVTMKITHVIRGNDHLSNTPKQILCYHALGYPVPAFAHIPMILGPDRSRLSKRHGATSVLAFKEEGFLPEAMVNYLARLGWSHGDQEIFSREELIEHFDLAKVGQAGAVFDRAKLEWLSNHWMRQAPGERLAHDLASYMERRGIPVPSDRRWLAQVADSLKERASTLRQMFEMGVFYFAEPANYDPPEIVAKFFTPEAIPRLALLIKRLEAQEAFEPDALESLYRGLVAQLELKLVDLAQLTRIALTGKTVSPPIFQVAAILGKERTLARLKKCLAVIEGKA